MYRSVHVYSILENEHSQLTKDFIMYIAKLDDNADLIRGALIGK